MNEKKLTDEIALEESIKIWQFLVDNPLLSTHDASQAIYGDPDYLYYNIINSEPICAAALIAREENGRKRHMCEYCVRAKQLKGCQGEDTVQYRYDNAKTEAERKAAAEEFLAILKMGVTIND